MCRYGTDREPNGVEFRNNCRDHNEAPAVAISMWMFGTPKIMLHTDFYVSFFNAVSCIVTRMARTTQSGIDSSAVDFGEEEWWGTRYIAAAI